MRSFLCVSLAALAAGACSAPKDQAAAPAPPGVQWVFVVLYNQPKDTAAFEKYYAETHVPLFASHAQEIGVTRAELIKFASTDLLGVGREQDRKSTRLNSSHANISYAVFCLKKKKKK